MTPRPYASSACPVRPSHAHETGGGTADARAREEEGGVRTRRTTTGSTETA